MNRDLPCGKYPASPATEHTYATENGYAFCPTCGHSLVADVSPPMLLSDYVDEVAASNSLRATIKQWQGLWDDDVWDDAKLAAEIMHLDVDAEGEPGEIITLRETIARVGREGRILGAEIRSIGEGRAGLADLFAAWARYEAALGGEQMPYGSVEGAVVNERRGEALRRAEGDG